MPQLATAFPQSDARPASSLADTLALVTQAGGTIADLRARLAGAERTIARLEEEKRTDQTEIRALRHDTQAVTTPVDSPPSRSHRDDTLAALVEGLGPSLVRVGP